MEEKEVSQARSEKLYSEMLLRQYPWLKGKMEEGEHPVAISYRKPDYLRGLSLAFIGLLVIVDTALHLTAYGGILPGTGIILVGTVLLWVGVWFLFFAKRSFILVTSERVLHQTINWMGKPGKERSIPRSQIKNVRLLKRTVMYRGGRSDGDISIELQSGRHLIVSSVHHGKNILDALQ